MRLSARFVLVLGFTLVGISNASGVPLQMRLTAPRRMINNKSLTILAEMLDENGNVDWQPCGGLGSVSVVRAGDNIPVSFSTVVFDLHAGTPPADSMRFYSGIGSVTLVLDGGTNEPGGDIIVSVSFGGLTSSRRVTVLSAPPMRTLYGTLTGDQLNWSPNDGVVHLTGNCSVPAGSTLNIEPGTLVMVDAGFPNAGTMIAVDGSLEAPGTADEPIFFFPSNPGGALRLNASCAEPNSNYFAWQGMQHLGSGSSLYRHVFITGAGNGEQVGHTRAPILAYDGPHSTVIDRCVFADNNGKAVYGAGTGTYTVRDTLVTRCGHGTEFTSNGYWTLLVEGSWYTGIGFGPKACDRDGDCINVRGTDAANGGPKVIRGCVMLDGNDDGVDQAPADFTVENCVIGYLSDTGIILDAGTSGSVTCNNVLTFGNRFGIGGRERPVYATNCTFADGTRLAPLHDCVLSTFSRCIVWPDPLSTCCGTVDHCDVGAASDLSCGVGNSSYDPQFSSIWQSGCDYTPLANSPALTAGPSGERIGWQGFIPPRRGAILYGVLSDAAARPGGTVSLDVYVDDAVDISSYSTRIAIALANGSGTLGASGSESVRIDDLRLDGLFAGKVITKTEDNANLLASATLVDGSASTGATARYLATFTLTVSADAEIGSTFQISIGGAGASSITDEFGRPVAFGVGNPLILTVANCPLVTGGSDQVICQSPLSVTLQGSAQDASSVTWTTSGDGVFGDVHSAVTDYTPGPNDLLDGNVLLTLTGAPALPCMGLVSDQVNIIWNMVEGGDVNMDGSVDAFDIQPFVAAVSSGEDACGADLTGDGAVNGDDVPGFVTKLLGL